MTAPANVAARWAQPRRHLFEWRAAVIFDRVGLAVAARDAEGVRRAVDDILADLDQEITARERALFDYGDDDATPDFIDFPLLIDMLRALPGMAAAGDWTGIDRALWNTLTCRRLADIRRVYRQHIAWKRRNKPKRDPIDDILG